MLKANNNGPEIYVADGSPSLFFDDVNGDGVISGGERAFLYFGLRRGGRVYYALDISVKDAPRFKWKVTAEQPSFSGNMAAGSNHVFVGRASDFNVGNKVLVPNAGPNYSDLIGSITAINTGLNRLT